MKLTCFHCAQPVEFDGAEPPWSADIDGVRQPMCCAGCQAVAESIVAAGLSDYYRTRCAPAPANLVPPALRDLAVYDDAQVQARFVRSDAAGAGRETSLMIEGLRCGACAWLIERALRACPGVLEVQVNLATERARLRWDPARIQLSELLAAVGRIGYRALPFDAQRREAQAQSVSRDLLRRLFIAGLGMMQVMMYAFPAYTAAAGDIDADHASLLRWASLVLTLPVMLYSARPFFAGAWRGLLARRPGMDLPVTIGLAAAFAASVVNTVRGHGEVYFDSVTMFVCLLLAARYLEWVARRRAARAIDAIAITVPDSVERVDTDGESQRIPATRIVPGDLFRVAVGERIAVDARVVDGRSAIDQSLLTGEALPVSCAPGDELPGGAINAGTPMLLRALRASADSAISTIERLVERGAAERPRLAALTDRIARDFVAALLLFALLVWGVWMLIDPVRAAPIAIAVLVVSCPCALSMATPASLAAGIGAALGRGMLMARGDALETIAAATDVVFDKTGTLTRGRPELQRIDLLGGAVAAADAGVPGAVAAADAGAPGATNAHTVAGVPGNTPAHTDADILAIAAALEAGQTHPLADAIARAHGGAAPAAGDRQTVPGLGVQATLADDRRYRLGSAAFVAQWHPAVEHAAHDAADSATLVWLADETGPIARLSFRDQLREEAREVLDTLAARGLRLHLLSGDRAASVAAVADELGIAEHHGEATPAAKLDYVRGLQREGRRVVMVGDGINDAPVLAAADVSIAVGRASALAQIAAGVVLLGASLADLPALHALATRTRRIIRQNLTWALVYNASAIPAAAFGFMPAWLAALGMSLSSLLVVGNALRLMPAARRTNRAQAPQSMRAEPAVAGL